jgi:hypothetical protein
MYDSVLYILHLICFPRSLQLKVCKVISPVALEEFDVSTIALNEGTMWWVFENKVLRRIFTSEKDEVKGIEDTFKMRRFITCTLHLISLGLLHQEG